MYTEMKKRAYTLKKRAESRDATRDRIVAATVALHEELGPKNTTISAVAERAGVQRLTVYRHFPDETALFKACTSQWLMDNPPPDPGQWQSVTGPERVHAALAALYGYYRRTRRMWTAAHRDEAEVRALRQPMKKFHDYLGTIAADLADSVAAGGARRDEIALTLHHAVQFETWHSLSSQGAGDESIADLVVAWLSALTGRSRF
jgi:AcrR family transcriptional regulator